MGKLDGKSVIVTGASRGIGAEIARVFAAEGGKVACVARTLVSFRFVSCRGIGGANGTAVISPSTESPRFAFPVFLFDAVSLYAQPLDAGFQDAAGA